MCAGEVGFRGVWEWEACRGLQFAVVHTGRMFPPPINVVFPVPLPGGSEGMLAALIDSFTAAPAALLGAYPCLPLLGGVRQALLASLAAAVKVRCWAA